MATEITRDEYMDNANKWSQYRSARTREAAVWTCERLSEPETEFAIVNRGSFWTVARRYYVADRAFA